MKKTSHVILCPCSHIKHNPCALMFFWCFARRFACVKLHIPGKAALCITCCPYFDAIFGRFAWHILSEWTAPKKCNQALINSQVEAWIVKQRKRCTHLSHTSLIATSLPCFVCLSSKRMTRDKTWNVFRDMVAGNIALPVSAFTF